MFEAPQSVAKTAKNMDEIQLLYDWLIINVFSSTLKGQIKMLNGPHMASRLSFGHAFNRMWLTMISIKGQTIEI